MNGFADASQALLTLYRWKLYPKPHRSILIMHITQTHGYRCSQIPVSYRSTWLFQFILITSKKQKSSRKTSTSALLTTPKPLTVWITINCGKFWKRWEYQTMWPVSWEICMQVKKQPLERDMEQQTGSKLGKEYIKAVYCHPPYLTCMQSTSWETLGWKKHKPESRLLGEISITSDKQTTPPLWQKVKRN